MKRKNLCLFFTNLMILFILFSCKSIDGECEPPEFKSPSVVFDSNGGERILKSTNDVSWWLYGLTINNRMVPWPWEEDSSLKISYENPDQPSSIIKIEGAWFTIEKVDNKTIKIKVDKTTESRNLSFEAYRGNCWQAISVNQEVE